MLPSSPKWARSTTPLARFAAKFRSSCSSRPISPGQFRSARTATGRHRRQVCMSSVHVLLIIDFVQASIPFTEHQQFCVCPSVYQILAIRLISPETGFQVYAKSIHAPAACTLCTQATITAFMCRHSGFGRAVSNPINCPLAGASKRLPEIAVQ